MSAVNPPPSELLLVLPHHWPDILCHIHNTVVYHYNAGLKYGFVKSFHGCCFTGICLETRWLVGVESIQVGHEQAGNYFPNPDAKTESKRTSFSCRTREGIPMAVMNASGCVHCGFYDKSRLTQHNYSRLE